MAKISKKFCIYSNNENKTYECDIYDDINDVESYILVYINNQEYYLKITDDLNNNNKTPCFINKDNVIYTILSGEEDNGIFTVYYKDGISVKYNITRLEYDISPPRLTATKIEHTNNIKYIGKYIFYSSPLLLSIYFPNCSYIDDQAFYSCSSLSVIDLPNCNYIGKSAFYSCTKLSSVRNFINCSYIDDYAFYGCKFTTIDLHNCHYIGDKAFCDTNLTSINLSNCNYIGKDAFNNCRSLTSIGNLSNCNYIGKDAFNNCTNLDFTSIKQSLIPDYSWINNQLSWIYPEIKWNNSSLITSIDLEVLPNNFNRLDNSVFYSCERLTSIGNLSNIVYIGDWAFYRCMSLASVNLPNCRYIGEGGFFNCFFSSLNLSNCSYIGSSAFNNCTYLTTIGDLSKCEYIGDNAFSRCQSLTTTGNLSNCSYIGTYAFCSCSSLTSVGNLSNCSYIGHDAFISCTSLTSVGNLSRCEYIGYNAFSSCSILDFESIRNTLPSNYSWINNQLSWICPELEWNGGKSLTIIDFQLTSRNLNKIDQSAFDNCSKLISLNNFSNCEYIGDFAFRNCYQLRTIDLYNCNYIGNSAFYACKSLSSLNLSNCSYIGSSAFYSCTSLTTIGDLSKCEYIGSNAFYFCSKLVSINNLSNCSYIGNYAFTSCTSLTAIGDLSKCEYIGNCAFSNCVSLITIGNLSNVNYVGSSAFHKCTSLTSIDLPNCYGIKVSTFYSCSNLVSVNLSNCRYIEAGGFSGCINLVSINLPNCAYIDGFAFYGCKSLETIDLPNCECISQYSAFTGCTSLMSVKLLYKGICKLENTTLFISTPITNSSYLGEFGSIYVPIKFLEQYKVASYWSNYKDRFVGIGYKLSLVDPTNNTIAYLNDSLIENKSVTYPYGNVTYEFYNPVWGKYIYSYNETRDDGEEIYTITPPTTYNTITYTGLSNEVKNNIKSIKIGYEKVTFDIDKNSDIKLGLPTTETEVTLEITFAGYKAIKRTDIISSSTTITLTDPEIATYEIVTINKDNASMYTTLIDDSNFVISEEYIQSGSMSYNVNNGYSKGYITFTTPNDIPSECDSVSVQCYTSSENKYDFGYVYISEGTTINYPTLATVKAATQSQSIPGYMYKNSGAVDLNTYTSGVLKPNTTYTLLFGYVKDGSTNQNSDRFFIKEITFPQV